MSIFGKGCDVVNKDTGSASFCTATRTALLELGLVVLGREGGSGNQSRAQRTGQGPTNFRGRISGQLQKHCQHTRLALFWVHCLGG